MQRCWEVIDAQVCDNLDNLQVAGAPVGDSNNNSEGRESVSPIATNLNNLVDNVDVEE